MLQLINTSVARKGILRAINVASVYVRLAHLLETYLQLNPTGKVGAKFASKFHEICVKEAPELKVSRVYIKGPGKVPFDGRIGVLTVEGYEFEPRSYPMRRVQAATTVAEAPFDIDYSLQDEGEWEGEVDRLTEKLTNFGYHAKKFNECLELLRLAASRYATGSPTLEEIFQYDQLFLPVQKPEDPLVAQLGGPAPVAEVKAAEVKTAWVGGAPPLPTE